jgi:hypothetical protein
MAEAYTSGGAQYRTVAGGRSHRRPGEKAIVAFLRTGKAALPTTGVWYRLNRWREEQITRGKHPTYGDLVRQYIALNQMERFEKIPHGRYINFVAEFLAAAKGVTRAEAIAAWTELKELDVPKDYASWVKARAKHKGKRR